MIGMIQASFCNICYHLILSHGIFLTVGLLRSKVTYCFIHPRLKKKRWCFAGLPHSTERSGLYVVVVRPVFAGRFSFSALVSTQHTAEKWFSAWEPWESTAEIAVSQAEIAFSAGCRFPGRKCCFCLGTNYGHVGYTHEMPIW